MNHEHKVDDIIDILLDTEARWLNVMRWDGTSYKSKMPFHICLMNSKDKLVSSVCGIKDVSLYGDPSEIYWKTSTSPMGSIQYKHMCPRCIVYVTNNPHRFTDEYNLRLLVMRYKADAEQKEKQDN